MLTVLKDYLLIIKDYNKNYIYYNINRKKESHFFKENTDFVKKKMAIVILRYLLKEDNINLKGKNHRKLN